MNQYIYSNQICMHNAAAQRVVTLWQFTSDCLSLVQPACDCLSFGCKKSLRWKCRQLLQKAQPFSRDQREQNPCTPESVSEEVKLQSILARCSVAWWTVHSCLNQREEQEQKGAEMKSTKASAEETKRWMSSRGPPFSLESVVLSDSSI